jgi:hypothetical protein
MINIVTYNAVFYKDAVSEMLTARHLDANWVNYLPSTGYVAIWVDETSAEALPSKVIACGFIREAEGNLQILESFATHPDASAQDRHNALDLITEKLMQKAETTQAKLICLTTEHTIIERSHRHGFVSTPFITLVKA